MVRNILRMSNRSRSAKALRQRTACRKLPSRHSPSISTADLSRWYGSRFLSACSGGHHRFPRRRSEPPFPVVAFPLLWGCRCVHSFVLHRGWWFAVFAGCQSGRCRLMGCNVANAEQCVKLSHQTIDFSSETQSRQNCVGIAVFGEFSRQCVCVRRRRPCIKPCVKLACGWCGPCSLPACVARHPHREILNLLRMCEANA